MRRAWSLVPFLGLVLGCNDKPPSDAGASDSTSGAAEARADVDAPDSPDADSETRPSDAADSEADAASFDAPAPGDAIDAARSPVCVRSGSACVADTPSAECCWAWQAYTVDTTRNCLTELTAVLDCHDVAPECRPMGAIVSCYEVGAARAVVWAPYEANPPTISRHDLRPCVSGSAVLSYPRCP